MRLIIYAVILGGEKTIKMLYRRDKRRWIDFQVTRLRYELMSL